MRRLEGSMSVFVLDSNGDVLGECVLPYDLMRDGFRLAMHNAFPTWSGAECTTPHGRSTDWRMHVTVDSLIDARMRNARRW